MSKNIVDLVPEFETRLISVSPDAENLIAYCARVSNPSNQTNPSISGLLKYCIRNEHWSIFEQANLVVEVKTTRAITAQILRHKSFSFQEFSQRYASVNEAVLPEARLQDSKNRQNSIEVNNEDLQREFEVSAYKAFLHSFEVYNDALEAGIAKECARAVLPMNTRSVININGTVRSWIHYLMLRTGNGTQLEHKRIADEIKETIFKPNFPHIYEALWGAFGYAHRYVFEQDESSHWYCFPSQFKQNFYDLIQVMQNLEDTDIEEELDLLSAAESEFNERFEKYRMDGSPHGMEIRLILDVWN